MSVCRRIYTFAVAILMGVVISFTFGSSTLEAHTVFKKALEKSYEGVKVSCNSCHIKGKSKKQRNEDLGKAFYEEMKDQNLTEEWKSKKGAEKKAYQTDVMIPAFQKALKIVKEKKKEEGGDTWHTLIETAQLDGLKLKDTGDEEE
jgi:ssDNA-binding Zn-finger/Zn-ribbon topoisomerase 1